MYKPLPSYILSTQKTLICIFIILPIAIGGESTVQGVATPCVEGWLENGGHIIGWCAFSINHVKLNNGQRVLSIFSSITAVAVACQRG